MWASSEGSSWEERPVWVAFLTAPARSAFALRLPLLPLPVEINRKRRQQSRLTSRNPIARSDTANSGASASGSAPGRSTSRLTIGSGISSSAANLSPPARANRSGLSGSGTKIGRTAEHALWIVERMQQEVADLMRHREAAPLPRLVTAHPHLTPGRQQQTGERRIIRRAGNGAQIVGLATRRRRGSRPAPRRRPAAGCRIGGDDAGERVSCRLQLIHRHAREEIVHGADRAAARRRTLPWPPMLDPLPTAKTRSPGREAAARVAAATFPASVAGTAKIEASASTTGRRHARGFEQT